MRRLRPIFIMPLLLALASGPNALAAPSAAELGTAYVLCEDRQGTGTLTSLADGGYVLTVGHVALDPETKTPADECRVGFVIDDSLKPKAFYAAEIVHATFEQRADRDMALLKIGPRLGSGPGELPVLPVRTSEFAAVGDPIVVRGYPGGMTTMQNATGTIIGYSRGTMQADAPISQGYSGGPAFDSQGNLIGMSERVTFQIDEATGQQTIIDYEFADILAVIAWLDESGASGHDAYLTHADHGRYHGAPYVIRSEEPGCAHLVRTAESPTVYCLLGGPQRIVFPNEATYRSWFADYSEVKYITTENLSEYRLIGNVTMKAGSLVKIQTDPRTYLVNDSIGTLRWIQTEERARALFGDGWATLVRDVPDAFFTDYRVGEPIE